MSLTETSSSKPRLRCQVTSTWLMINPLITLWLPASLTASMRDFWSTQRASVMTCRHSSGLSSDHARRVVKKAVRRWPENRPKSKPGITSISENARAPRKRSPPEHGVSPVKGAWAKLFDPARLAQQRELDIAKVGGAKVLHVEADVGLVVGGRAAADAPAGFQPVSAGVPGARGVRHVKNQGAVGGVAPG